MDDIFYEKLLYRIIRGRIRLRLGDLVLIIHEPSLELIEESIDIYEEAYKKAYFREVPIKSQIIETLFDNELWSPFDDKEAEKKEKQIEDLKVEAFKSFYNTKKLRGIKMNIRKLELQASKLRAKKTCLDHTTCEGVGNFSRSSWLISQSTFLPDGKPYDWSPYNISNVMDEYNSTSVTVEQFRHMARNDPWRSMWNVGKKQSLIFDKPSTQLTKDQLSLSSYSTLYDNVYESPKSPNEKVIDDDDCLDGWLIQQRRESEKDRKQQEVDGMIKNKKIANSQEIFVMADNQESANEVYGLNDPIARNVVRSREQQIRSADGDMVKNTDLGDVRQDITIQAHQQGIDQIKGRAR